MEIPTNLSVAENSTNAQQWRNQVQEYQRKFEQLSEDQKLFKLCDDAGLRLVAQGHHFYTLDTEEGQQMQHLIREYTMPRNEKWTRIRGWILKNTRIGPVLNIKVCYHDDRYCIEVQIPSLFQDSTVSWVRIVNGVDKYVTESMLTTKEEDIASGKTHCWSKTTTEAHRNVWLPFPFLFLKGNGSILKHNEHMIISVMKCQKPSPDCYDMINQSLEEATERSTTVTLLTSAGRRSSTMLRNGYLKIGYKLWQKEEERREDFNIAWIQLLPISSCTFEQFKKEREWIEFYKKKWIYSRRNKPQERKASGLLHYSEPDGRRIWHVRNSTRSDETKDCDIKENLETPSK